MTPDQLRLCLDSADAARPALAAWGLRDAERGRRNLAHLAARVGLDGLAALCAPLARLLPRSPDPDRALNNLERFLAHPAAPGPAALLDGKPRPLDALVQLFGTSQSLADLLAASPELLDVLRQPPRRPPTTAELVAALQADLDAAPDAAAAPRCFSRFRQRHLLRVGVNDVVRDRPLEEVTRDLSRVADAAVEAALRAARKNLARRHGQPFTAAGAPARVVALAFGKLGGVELNYSSDLDLMFVYDDDGATRGGRQPVGNDEHFAAVVAEAVRLLTAHTDRGQAYRVDLRLRPEGQRGPLARSLASTLAYYDSLGRTWERQALIKARPVAGDLGLGDAFLAAVEPFVYRRYLSFAEINEIKAMKRRVEQQAARGAAEVKTGRGGIRDIEFTIQFLQLANGGDLPALRQRNTLLALHALEEAGCLTDQEYRVLDDAYRFLRKTEHRLQLLFDLQTHRLPDDADELRRLARRMGYREPVRSGGAEERRSGGEKKPAGGPSFSPAPPLLRSSASSRRSPLDDAPPAPDHDLRALLVDPLDRFLQDYRDKTEPTRRILEHLLHDSFAGGDGDAAPEADLILAPNPGPDTVRAVLGRYGFRDAPAAYQNLLLLAQESVPFLSTRRCRHFLASIAPALLRAVAATPDPDLTLVNLEKVTAALGARAVLWELFSFNPPSLGLCVDLCAWSQLLSALLISNPGMIDELLDSLVLNQPRAVGELHAELAELCRGASDPAPILRSFQDKELLRIGVRDVLGKDGTRATAAALGDLAEVLLARLAAPLPAALEARHGAPLLADGPRAGAPCRWAVVSLGKLGGRELTYHSDLDLLVVYEGDGRTAAPPGAAAEATDNFPFFTELAQRLIRAAANGDAGRLYAVDMRLRPTGRSGGLVVPLGELRRYFGPCGAGQLWERLALTRARVVAGDAAFGAEVQAAVADAAFAGPWAPECVDEALAMRRKLEAGRSPRDLKRGSGGLVDVEFLVQVLQLRHGAAVPALRATNTWDALAAARDAGLLDADEHAGLEAAWDFLFRARARLRLAYNRSLDELPAEPAELDKLARRLGLASGAALLAELERHTARARGLLLRVADRQRAPRPGPGERWA